MNSKSCKDCGDNFLISDSDRDFYTKMDLPDPKHCPDCRQRRRILQLNQLQLFKRDCGATGKPMITNHPPYVQYPVYSQLHWYSDAVDNTEYGQEIDFKKPFFEQFAELSKKAARPALFTDFTRDENSAFTNYAGKNKNCYLIFDSDENWDCLYSYSANSCKNSIDCYRGDKLELCYEAIDCSNCYACIYAQDCHDCSESMFIKNCISARNSLFCANLFQKENYLFNEPSTKVEIQKVREAIKDLATLKIYKAKYEEFLKTLPDRATKGVLNEDSVGNYLYQCKNAKFCFDCRNVWDGAYIYQAFMSVKNSMDCNEVGEAELLYQCCDVGYNAFNCQFCINCLNQLSDLLYCDYCFLGCKNLFGCIGLKKKEFCILNKQYSKEEYFKLKAKLIAHMKETGEWGEYFPPKLSPFAYNHSHAQIFYPLSKSEAISLGFWWYDDKSDSNPVPISETIKECCSCSSRFRLVPAELEFYKLYNLNAPEQCFMCRHQARLSKRANRFVFEQACGGCKKQIVAPSSKNKVSLLCESCFASARL